MAYVPDSYDSTVSTAVLSNGSTLGGWFVATARAVMSLVSIFLFLFGWRPTAYEHLHLDRLGLGLDIEPANRMRRYRSWRQRLALHSLFTGFGFTAPQAIGSA